MKKFHLNLRSVHEIYTQLHGELDTEKYTQNIASKNY